MPKGRRPPSPGYSYQLLNSAFGDYVAARCLLMQGQFVWQGAMLASMAVEKYIKAVLGIRGATLHRHLDSYAHFHRAFQESDTRMPPALTAPFVAVLGRAYSLRYYNELRESNHPRSCGFFQWQLLAQLDELIHQFEGSIVLSKPSDPVTRTPYQQAFADRSHALCEGNWIVRGEGKQAIAMRPGFFAKYVEDRIVILEFHNPEFASPVERFVSAEVVLSDSRRQVEFKFSERMDAPPNVLNSLQMVAHES